MGAPAGQRIHTRREVVRALQAVCQVTFTTRTGHSPCV